MKRALERAITVSFGILAGASAAAAQEACLDISDSAARLACYDAANAPPDPGHWRALQDAGTLGIALEAMAPIACSPFLPIERPVLLVRCQADTTSVIFSTRACRFAPNRVQGTLALDDAPFAEALLLPGDNNRALGAWAGNRSVPLAKEMVRADILYFRATPQSGTPFTARFALEGLGAALAPLREECGW